MVKLPKHLTCLYIHEHRFEGWDVAALDSLQHLHHVPDLPHSQLIVNALQVITPTATKARYKPTLGSISCPHSPPISPGPDSGCPPATHRLSPNSESKLEEAAAGGTDKPHRIDSWPWASPRQQLCHCQDTAERSHQVFLQALVTALQQVFAPSQPIPTWHKVFQRAG